MTEANSASWKCEGAKADLRMEDFVAYCLAEAVPEEAAEEFLESGPRADFLLMLAAC